MILKETARNQKKILTVKMKGISRQESSVKVKYGLSYESYSNIRKRNAFSENERLDSNVRNTVYKTHHTGKL